MTESPMSHQFAMALSIAEDRVVHLTWSTGLASELFAECDGESENGDVHEYWGPDKDCDGNAVKPWRVHLHGVDGQARDRTPDAPEPPSEGVPGAFFCDSCGAWLLEGGGVHNEGEHETRRRA